MHFKVGLSRPSRGNESIWVIVDRLTNTSRFIAIKTTRSVKQLVEIYVWEIVKLHRVLRTIISDRDFTFLSYFWKELQEAFGIKLSLSIAFHPTTDGQTETTI